MSQKRLPAAEMLKQARKRLGLSGRAIARISGKPSSYIQKLESGAVSPTLTLLEELCPFYGIEPFEVVLGQTKEDLIRQVLGPVPFNDPAVKEILQIAAMPDGLSNIRSLLEIVKDRPEKLSGVLRMVKLMRESGMLKE